MAVPRIALADELIDGVPAFFVLRRKSPIRGRLRHGLTPEEAHQVRGHAAGFHPAWLGNHSSGDHNLRRAVTVEVERIARPSPASHFGLASLFKRAVAFVAIQRVALGVAMILLAQAVLGCEREGRIVDHATTRRRPHVRDVEIGPTRTVRVEPGGAHARAEIFDACIGGDVAEALPVELV